MCWGLKQRPPLRSESSTRPAPQKQAVAMCAHVYAVLYSTRSIRHARYAWCTAHVVHAVSGTHSIWHMWCAVYVVHTMYSTHGVWHTQYMHTCVGHTMYSTQGTRYTVHTVHAAYSTPGVHSIRHRCMPYSVALLSAALTERDSWVEKEQQWPCNRTAVPLSACR